MCKHIKFKSRSIKNNHINVVGIYFLSEFAVGETNKSIWSDGHQPSYDRSDWQQTQVRGGKNMVCF